MAIRQTEIDGVPTLVAPSAGRTVAGLVFRVGRADETLPRTGITHLLEHLALHPLGLTDYHYNGSTGPTETSFHTAGSGDDVAAFLMQVCDGLSALPLARLETEKSIIRTEWSSRSTSVYSSLPLWRYGARSYGLLSYSEPGVRMITPAELEHWGRTWFTRENAVLWIAGDIPAGLRLRLPSGRRMPLPEPTSALPSTPAYFRQGAPAVIMDAIVASTPAARLYAEVLERSLMRDLRQEGGVSYSASTNLTDLGNGSVSITAGVDALPEQVDAALGGFVDVLAKLRVGRIVETDISSYVAKARETVKHPDAEAGTLAGAAFQLLAGRPVQDLEQRLAGLEAVTTADVQAVAIAALETSLLGVPEGRDAEWAGFDPAPACSTSTITGNQHRSLESDQQALYVGTDGVMTTYNGSPSTARFDQLSAVFVWPDGARRLIAHDGVVVHYEPTMWQATAGITAHIDAAIDPRLVIVLPAREAGDIPVPQRQDGKPVRQPSAGWNGWELTGLILSIALGVVFLCIAGLFSAVAADDTGAADDIGWGLPITSFVCMAVFLAPAAILVIRRKRAQRR